MDFSSFIALMCVLMICMSTHPSDSKPRGHGWISLIFVILVPGLALGFGYLLRRFSFSVGIISWEAYCQGCWLWVLCLLSSKRMVRAFFNHAVYVLAVKHASML